MIGWLALALSGCQCRGEYPATQEDSAAATIPLPTVDTSRPDTGFRDVFFEFEQINVGPDGSPVDVLTLGLVPSINRDGRFVAFTSQLDSTGVGVGIVPGHLAGPDVFIRDRQLGSSYWATYPEPSITDRPSLYPSLSGDGDIVAYESLFEYLVPDDTNGFRDIFYTRQSTGEIHRVSVNGSSEEADDVSSNPSISRDGNVIAFESWATNLVTGVSGLYSHIYAYDVMRDSLELVTQAYDGSEANTISMIPSLNEDGSLVAFTSWASNLTASEDNNGISDIFVTDRNTGQTERVSVSSTGLESNGHSFGPRISANGRFVSFVSSATNLVADDNNGVQDVFVHDRLTGITERVNVSESGVEANDESGLPSLSGDGRYVSFASAATNLVPGDTNGFMDVFVYDRHTAKIRRVSVDINETQAEGGDSYGQISDDGRYIAFWSNADLVPGDSNNGQGDIFLVGSVAYFFSQSPDTGL